MTLNTRSICVLLLLAACSADDSGEETTIADGSGSASASSSMSDGSAEGSTSSASASDDSTTEPTTSATASDDSGSDTGTPSSACTSSGDCVLVNDCCTCAAFHVDDAPGTCDMDCEQSSCSAQNLEGISAACVFGHCEIADLPCNPAMVACDSLPPRCPEGSLPQVVDGCWGSCIPAAVCDVVPDCSSCPDDETCVEHSVGFAGVIYTCEPIAPDCDGTPTCACMPGVCDQGADTCVDGDGSVTCACLDC